MAEQTQQEKYTETRLKKYTVCDDFINGMGKAVMRLKVTGPDDNEGYDLVNKARKEVKAKRCEVEATRKELKKESNAYGKAVDAEAKRLTELITPIEEYLIGQEKIVTDEKERLEKEKQEAIERKLNDRISRLFEIGMRFYDGQYAYELKMPDPAQACPTLQPEDVENAPDLQFVSFIHEAAAIIDKDKAKVKAAVADQEAKDKELEDLREKVKLQEEKDAAKEAPGDSKDSEDSETPNPPETPEAHTGDKPKEYWGPQDRDKLNTMAKALEAIETPDMAIESNAIKVREVSKLIARAIETLRDPKL